MEFPNKLHTKLENRKSSNSFRSLYSQHDLIDFSSNDYIGFAINDNISNKTKARLDSVKYLNGSTGSRLLSGNLKIHEEVEDYLSGFFNCSSSLLFNSGYVANIGLLSSVPERGDIILFDELCHASIRDGIRLSNAKSYSFEHNNVEDLEKRYKNTVPKDSTVYIVVESIYSMDGDMAPLIDISGFCDKLNCFLIVDEAHATGLFGKNGSGLIDELGIQDKVFARIVTFGKALGCHGAVILGSKELINYLINFARSFIYTTSMPVHNALTILYAFQELEITDEISKLKSNIDKFKKEIEENNLKNKFIDSNSSIQGCIIGDPSKVKVIAANFKANNFDVKAILSPTVPKGTERLRFCIHSYNSFSQIEAVLKLICKFV